MKHKHYDCIVAWAEGKQIQYFQWVHEEWVDTLSDPRWFDDVEYRIKPEPKPDVVYYSKILANAITLYHPIRMDGDNLRLTFDGETGKLKSAEVI